SPGGGVFLSETKSYLQKQKAKLLRVVPVSTVKGAKGLEHFALEVELGKDRFWMDYYVSRQTNGGCTVAARLLHTDLTALRKDVARVAHSVVITRKIIDKPAR